MHILSIDCNKSPLQISGKVAGGVCEDSQNFSGHPAIYWAHRAVVFAIARLSCWRQSPQQEQDMKSVPGLKTMFILMVYFKYIRTLFIYTFSYGNMCKRW